MFEIFRNGYNETIPVRMNDYSGSIMTTSTADAPALTKYARLAEMLRRQIAGGQFAPGDRLPSFSEFRAEHGVTISTVEKVFTILEREGLIERFRGKGVFVAQRQTTLKCIGFLSRPLARLDWTSYWTHLVEGIQDGAHAAGYKIMLVNPDLPTAWNEGLGGVITHEHQREDPPQLRVPTPRVCVLSPSKSFASVVADDYGGVHQAVEHLLQLGHRRIAYLSADVYWWQQQRVSGYLDALREAGIVPEERWLRAIDCRMLPFRERAADAMRDWLKSDWRELGCTALLCYNDGAALGVMEVLQEYGIRIPDELSLIGFDGTILCETASPKLTTVQVPLREIGLRAVRVLIEQIEAGESEAVSLSLPTTLKPGGSTSRLAKHSSS